MVVLVVVLVLDHILVDQEQILVDILEVVEIISLLHGVQEVVVVLVQRVKMVVLLLEAKVELVRKHL
mgnify:CR=1 FL=1